jgi:pyrimidine 5'-nucleotidase
MMNTSFAMDVFLFLATASFACAAARKDQQRHKRLLEAFETAPDGELLASRALKEGFSLDANEKVCTVSPDNVPTATGHLRRDVRLQNLWHRATYMLLRQASLPSSSWKDAVVFVQRRSKYKDYGPGLLDPSPGGVVGFGESYQDNAVRELQEEMGISIVERKAKGAHPSNTTMERLFTFSYEDERVRVWGDFFEVLYHGSVEDLKLQDDEVEEVLTMTLGELYNWMNRDPASFLPDSCHAMKLYFQRRVDRQVSRRLLKGYSSGDLDRYGLRPKPQVVFFDCDDCLYFDDWHTANALTAKINAYCVEKVGLPPGHAYELYKQYGTALRGLLAEGHIENTPEAIDAFLEDVHDLPISQLLQPDPKLRHILLQMDPSIPKYIFTASVRHHAERCLKALGIADLFESSHIIDVKSCNLETKHSPSSFRAAMDIAGVKNPESCVFLDDSVKNIEAARDIGWRSILVGKVGRDCGKPISSDHAELEIDRIHEIVSILPELFEH